MELYDYQKKVISCCLSCEKHSQLVSMPTGTGKTITFLALAKELSKRTLIIVHREELLKQTQEKALFLGYKQEEIAVITAMKKEELKLINIAMVQTLSRNLELYKPEDIEVIIVDEAHHATAESYKKILKFFKIDEVNKYLFGFTATPLRGDKQILGEIFQEHVFKMTLTEATQLGYIVPVHGIRVEIKKDFADIETKQGDYDLEKLEKVMNCDSINKLIVERCRYLTKTPCIIFSTSVNHAETLSKMLRDEKRKAISVSYKTPKKTLERIYSMLKQGRIDFITNAVKLSEGFDHPAIQGVIVARPTRSPVLYKQMIGRGLRNFPDKYECFVMEFTGNDPAMIKWEDIDENATFQSSSSEKQKTREEAKNGYKQIFRKTDVIILDVRVSPFSYYECKMRRFYSYKNYYFVPFEEGFLFFELVPRKSSTKSASGTFFYIYGTTLFWEKKYESVYVWDEPNYCMYQDCILNKDDCLRVAKHYCGINKFGRWYPSELENVTPKQKYIMKKNNIGWASIKSARKAEMLIEEQVIRKYIDKYLAKHQFSGILTI